MQLCYLCSKRSNHSKYSSRCYVCNGLANKVYDIAHKVIKDLSKIEFDTFLVGSRLPEDVVAKDEEFINKFNAKPLKNAINQEFASIIIDATKKRLDRREPDVVIILDLARDTYSIDIRSLYIYGEYQKVRRGIPQARWLCRCNKSKDCKLCNGLGKLYRISIQEIIAKPIIKESKASDSAIHASGREDVDVRCLAYRPFVIEMIKPKKRSIDLSKIEQEINKSRYVKVRGLRFSNKQEAIALKQAVYDKTYHAEVTFANKVDQSLLARLDELKNKPITQETPYRVKHRRADRVRVRRVRSVEYKLLSRYRLALRIRAESGLYIKEFIHGDKGLTKPSIAELLNNKVKSIRLDVIEIHKVII